MDKPAEGLFGDIESTIGGFRVVAGKYTGEVHESMEDAELDRRLLQDAHTSIVKPLREKAETLEGDCATSYQLYAKWKAKAIALAKDRDAWKEKAQDMGKAFLSEQKAAYAAIADADRLAESLGAIVNRLDAYMMDPAMEEMPDRSAMTDAKEALAAHESLKGKT